MTDKMTLLERLRNPAWVHDPGLDRPTLDVERTMADMEEAAREIEKAPDTDRPKVAYQAFRGGFGDKPCPAPPWEDAESWIRDVVTVAYLQGTLDRRR